jgi:fucose permease
MWTIAICASVAGFGFSSVFPIAVATLSHKFGTGASRIAGLMFAFSSLGGAVLPLLVGHVSARLGSLRMAWLVPVCGGVTVLMLNVLLERLGSEGKEA